MEGFWLRTYITYLTHLFIRSKKPDLAYGIWISSPRVGIFPRYGTSSPSNPAVDYQESVSSKCDTRNHE